MSNPTFNIANPIYIVNKSSNVDFRYGPWSSIQDTNNNVNINLRSIGLTVGISALETGVVEYWYKNGVDNSNLIIKNVDIDLSGYLPLSGGTITNSLSVGKNLSATYITVHETLSTKFINASESLTAKFITVTNSLTATNIIRAINRVDTNNCDANFYNFLPIRSDNFFNIIIGRGFGPQQQTAPNIQSNFSGGRNTIIGFNAGFPITTGNHNTYIGVDAGREVRTGSFNFALGQAALNDNQHGSGNIAIGQAAGARTLGDDNVFIGRNSDARGFAPSLSVYRNIIIGQNSTAGGFNDTLVIGRSTNATETGQIVLSSLNGVFRTTLSTFNIGSIDRPNNLNVFGSISTNNIIYANNQNSEDWNSVYSSVLSNSANWNIGGGTGGGSTTIIEPLTGNWNSVYSYVLLNSSNYILDGGNTKSSNLSIGTNDNFNLNLKTNSLTRFSITSSGNVGIETSNPNEKLTVVGNISSSNNITASNLTIQQKISSQESISNSLSSQTVKISNILFTGKSTTAASLTGDNLFVEVIVGNQKKYLQLFDIELPLLIYTINFENSTKGNYDPGNVNLNGLLWYFNNTLIGTLVGDYKEGLKSGRLRGYANSEIRMVESKPTGIGDVSFKYRSYLGDTVQIEWLVQYSMNAGLSWTTFGTFTATDTVQTFNATVNEAGNGRIRFIANTSLPDANRRTNIDDIVITEFL